MRLASHLSCIMVTAVVVCNSALAQSSEDPFDVSRGGRPDGGSPTQPLFPVSYMFLGGADRALATVFRDDTGRVGTVDGGTVSFFPDSAPVIRGVDLYTLAEGGIEDGPRGTALFRLRADTTGAGGFDRILLDGVNPRDDGTVNRYEFTPIRVFRVWGEVTRSSDLGPRIVELDGIAVPEPGSAGALALVAAAALLRRRRVSCTGG